MNDSGLIFRKNFEEGRLNVINRSEDANRRKRNLISSQKEVSQV
jgi:hypothetical protein